MRFKPERSPTFREHRSPFHQTMPAPLSLNHRSLIPNSAVLPNLPSTSNPLSYRKHSPDPQSHSLEIQKFPCELQSALSCLLHGYFGVKSRYVCLHIGTFTKTHLTGVLLASYHVYKSMFLFYNYYNQREGYHATSS